MNHPDLVAQFPELIIVWAVTKHGNDLDADALSADRTVGIEDNWWPRENHAVRLTSTRRRLSDQYLT